MGSGKYNEKLGVEEIDKVLKAKEVIKPNNLGWTLTPILDFGPPKKSLAQLPWRGRGWVMVAFYESYKMLFSLGCFSTLVYA